MKRLRKLLDFFPVKRYLWIIVVLTACIFGLLFLSTALQVRREQAELQKNWNTKLLYEVALKMQTHGFVKESLDYYKSYYNSIEAIKDKETVAYTIASLHEELNEWENALGWYYVVQECNLNKKNEAIKRINVILEKTGKNIVGTLSGSTNINSVGSSSINGGNNSQGKLNDDLDFDPELEGEAILAEVFAHPIYLHEVEAIYEGLPDEEKRQYRGQKGKNIFIKKFLSEEILFYKAESSLANDKSIRRQVEQFKRHLLGKKFLKDEIEKKVLTEESDVINFYNTRPELFTKSAAIAYELFSFKEQKRAAELVNFFTNVNTQTLTNNLFQGEISNNPTLQPMQQESAVKQFKDYSFYATGELKKGSPFMDFDREAVSLLFNEQKGNVVGPIFKGGYYYVIKIKNRIPDEKVSYKDVRKKVIDAYKQEKIEKYYDKIIQELVKNEQVKILDKGIFNE